MKRLIIFLVIVFAMSLSACSTLKPDMGTTSPITATSPPANAAAIRQWSVQGAIAIKKQSKGWNASYHWRQQGNTFNIAIYGPLGAGAVKLHGQSAHVTMVDAKGKILRAKSPEQLVEKGTGWRIPISNLRYWIRGIVAPGAVAQKQLNENHSLQILQQQGWRIEFKRYQRVKSWRLPRLITLYKPPLRVRIVIKHWKVS